MSFKQTKSERGAGYASICTACSGPLKVFGIRKKFVYCRCDSCGTLQLAPLPDKVQLDKFYGERYAGEGHYYGDPEEALRGNRPLYEAVAAIVSNKARPGCRVLDIGCGWGHLCRIIKERGFDCLGLDPSPVFVGYCCAHGLKVTSGDLEMPGAVSGQFGAVTSVAVIEHLVNHEVFFRNVISLLEPEGVAVILCPTAWVPAKLGMLHLELRRTMELPELHRTFCPPWHTVLFSIKGLSLMIKRAGFILEQILPAPSGRDRGAMAILQKAATIVSRMGFLVFGDHWPVSMSHIFVCRKPS